VEDPKIPKDFRSDFLKLFQFMRDAVNKPENIKKITHETGGEDAKITLETSEEDSKPPTVSKSNKVDVNALRKMMMDSKKKTEKRDDPKFTLETSGEDAKISSETSGEDAKITLETGGEDAKITLETSEEDYDSFDQATIQQKINECSLECNFSKWVHLFKLLIRIDLPLHEDTCWNLQVLKRRAVACSPLVSSEKDTCSPPVSSGEDTCSPPVSSGEDNCSPPVSSIEVSPAVGQMIPLLVYIVITEFFGQK
jgi:hypothetical protein